MIKSSQPRKQRKFRFNAPIHVRQKFLNVHISKELREKLNIKKRAIGIRKGDTVKVMAGPHKGKTGKVTDVNLRTGIVLVDSIKRKKANGKEILVPIHSSNLYITDLDLSDKYRKAIIERAGKV